MTRKISFILIIGAVLSLHVFGQPSEAERQRARENEERKIEIERSRIQNQSDKESSDFNKMLLEGMAANIARANNPSQPLSKKEVKEILKNLEPNAEDLAKYKSFLKQSKTGIFRLMPNYNCTEKLIINVKEGCEKSFYKGEYYSFVTDEYGDNSFFDLTYKNGDLTTSSFWLQSIMTSLGDIPLESLTETSSGLKYLFDFAPQQDHKAVKKQFVEILKGVKADGHQYSRSSKALLNNTYALRLIGYRFGDSIKFRYRGAEPTSLDMKILSASYRREGADILLAFRIIRQDTDGSLTILWKKLRKQKSPKIIFGKNEPLSNFGIDQ